MFKNQLKTILLLGSLSALLVGLGALVAPSMLTLFAGLAILMNIGAYFFSDRLVLRMHHASEVDSVQAPSLHAMVQELATAAKIPKPRIFVIPEDQPNAFATGRNPAHGVVAVTRGLMSLLDEGELRGILAHEIAHIKNRDILIGSMSIVALSAIFALPNRNADNKSYVAYTQTAPIPESHPSPRPDPTAPTRAPMKDSRAACTCTYAVRTKTTTARRWSNAAASTEPHCRGSARPGRRGSAPRELVEPRRTQGAPRAA